MTETSRVQRWRAKMKADGKEAMTLWISRAEKLRLETLAQTRHCSPSAVVEYALSLIGTGPPVPGLATETAQLRALIREEVVLLLPTLGAFPQGIAPDSEGTGPAASTRLERALSSTTADSSPPWRSAPTTAVPGEQSAQAQETRHTQTTAGPADLPTYDSSRYYLGAPCTKPNHTYADTGLNLRRLGKRDCVECDKERKRQGRAQKKIYTNA